MTDHDQNVQRFLKEAQAEDPEHYKEVCDKYPVLTAQRWRAIRRHEVTVGLNLEDQAHRGESDD